eukprot:TRINITY_DN14524_c0_g1_i1.p1 TRINITY_DN14524_c0_g1~~TRINITY_DN14524_c0_g1_i1.p1  ORF type:complete len:522 (-),score=119.31 TRINITY_DN14524_c0_g1_i1:8-1573(-)
MSKRRLLYSEKCMQDAIKAAQEGMSIRQAATKFNVPKTTLFDKLSGKSPEVTKMGRNTVLTPTEEKFIVDWILKCRRRGLSPSKGDILNSIQNLILKDRNRKTPFTNNRPGKTWLQLFMSRHPVLNSKADAVKPPKREESIRDWFRGVEEQMTEMNAMDIFKDPSRIFSTDELNIELCPKSGKVIGPRDWKNVHDLPPGPDKSTMSFLRTFSAGGDIVSPSLFYPYLRVPSDIINAAPNDIYIGASESGWVKSETFIKFLEDAFIPWISKNSVVRPVILFVSGKTTHCTVQLSDFCEENDIILYLIPPNTVDAILPAQAGELKPFKRDWNELESLFSQANPQSCVRRTDVASLLGSYLSHMDRTSIINSFIITGLCPLNPNAVNYAKVTLKKPRKAKSSELDDMMNKDIPFVDQVSKYKIARSVLVELLPKSKISQAKKNKGDQMLAELWSKINSRIYFETKKLEDTRVLATIIKDVDSDEVTTEMIIPVDSAAIIANSPYSTVELDMESGTQYSYVILDE